MANEQVIIRVAEFLSVAVAPANFGLDSGFVSAIPCNPIGEACIRELRGFGVDVGQIKRSGNRLGIAQSWLMSGDASGRVQR